MKRTLLVLLGLGSALLAAEGPAKKVQVVHTERVEFPSGGLLDVRHSVGELSVEGWDQPDVEITTIKSTKDEIASAGRVNALQELDKVRIAVERQGEALVISADIPRHQERPKVSFDVEYRIKAPRNARLAVAHGDGEVHVDNLTSDIRVTIRKGDITLHLPAEGQYGIDAKSDLGGVNSDFPGLAARLRWRFGHTLVQAVQGGHQLYLRSHFGDITIMKSQRPVVPGVITH